MERGIITSMDLFINALRDYFILNKRSNLTNDEKERKNDLEIQINTCLNDLDTFSMQETKSSQVSYSSEIVSKFLDGFGATYLSEEQEQAMAKAKAFREKLTELMDKKKVKSKEVIEGSGINQSVFSKVKVGIRLPTKEVLEALSKYFKYDLSKYE